MNTDDLKQLARHADSVSGREPARLHEVRARVRTTRRRRVKATAAGAVLTLAVGVVVLSPRLFGDSPPPTLPATPSSPTPTQTLPSVTPTTDGLFHPPRGTKTLTLRQTVLGWNAEQLSGVTSPDDPYVRLSIWRTACVVCPAGEAGHPRFIAMALTRDGYQTPRYLRLPTEVDDLDPPTISGPVPGVFLLAEHLNGPSWVLHANGVLRPLRQVAETSRVGDRRLVYRCESESPDLGFTSGWCRVDPSRATKAPVSGTSAVLGQSAGNPGLGQAPWGIVNTTSNGPGDTAWWQDHGVRRTQELALTAPRGIIRSLGADDVPTYWTSKPRAHSMQVHVVRPRSGGLVSLGSRQLPRGFQRGHGYRLEDTWHPGSSAPTTAARSRSASPSSSRD